MDLSISEPFHRYVIPNLELTRLSYKNNKYIFNLENSAIDTRLILTPIELLELFNKLCEILEANHINEGMHDNSSYRV
jgi:hypothetical protein